MKRVVPVVRRTIVALSLVFSLGLSVGAPSFGRSVASTASMAAASNDSTRQTTVHVKSYTKKDGTKVAGYDRKVTEAKTPAAPTGTNSATATRTPARDSQGRFVRGEAAKNTFMSKR